MTERFVSAAEMMCRVLGMPDYRFAVVQSELFRRHLRSSIGSRGEPPNVWRRARFQVLSARISPRSSAFCTAASTSSIAMSRMQR